MTEDPSITLQTVICEFKNISPELIKAFVFKKDGEIMASMEEGFAEDRAQKIVCSYEEIAGQAEVIGGIESLRIQGVSTELEIEAIDNRYLTTVVSRAADEKMVKALTRVIVPTVIKLLDKVKTTTADQPSGAVNPVANEPAQVTQPSIEPTEMRQRLDASVAASKHDFPKPPVNQFMVEKIGGLLVASDVVRVDAEVVAKWGELFGHSEITLVNVETLAGKAVICKFKPMRETEGNVKGVIQIPERILQALGTSEGKLVMVKPFIPTAKEEQP